MEAFKDLNHIAHQAMENFTTALKSYYNLNTSFILDLEPQMQYYVGAAKLVKDLRSHGLKMCKPVIEPKENRIFECQGIADMAFVIELLYK